MPALADALTAARARIAAAYDPNALQEAGTKLIEALAAHLRRVESRETKVLNWREPRANIREAREFLNESPLPSREEQGEGLPRSTTDIATRIADIARTTLDRGQNLHSPHYVGHQVPAPVPLAGLFDLVGTVTNQVMAIYEMGPWATSVERAVVDAMGERIGLARGTFSGLVTSGGTLANLTGLLAARNVTLKDSWSAGLAAGKVAPAIVVHAESHYSVTRAAGIMGLGTDQIVMAALDDRRRMDPNRLDHTLKYLRSRGVPIVAVSATSCATPIGAFDPLPEIADVCERHGVWLHVDAAHGGAVSFSDRHRHLLAGIERADTVVCDAHKMMFMPALCALLFYKDPTHRRAAFSQEAPYLFDPLKPEMAEFDSGVANLECTKRAAAFGVWGIWSLFGPQIFADMVDVTIDLAQQFYAMLREAEDFEALHEPQCNIVAFRHLPRELRDAPAEQVDMFQLRLRRAVIESGEFYLVGSRIDGRPVLRTTMMNPLTTVGDLQGLMECLRRFGRSFEANGR